MGLFDKLARRTADGRVGDQPSTESPRETVSINATPAPEVVIDLPPPGAVRLPSPQSSRRVAALRPPAGPTVPRAGETYDPTQPRQSPVAGIDLVTFAEVTRRLLDTPAHEQPSLLARYGHGPETWSAVHTAWMARLGQMPFLYETYEAASRSR